MKLSMRTTISVAFAAGLAMVAATPVTAQSALDELVKKAGEEGEVAINTSTTRYPATAAPAISKALSDKFGVDIKVEFVNTAPAPVTAGQMIKEHEAGIKPSTDASPLPLSFIDAIGKSGAIEEIDWAGIGVPAEQIDPNGQSIWIHTIPRAVFYNTDLVTGDDIPTKLADLLDPKWKGKIAGPGFGDAYGMIAVPVLGEEGGADWVKGLYEDQELSVIRSMTDVPARVANGEFALGMGVPANYSGLVTKGAPIANAPLEKVGGQPYYYFVQKNADHPNAAALLAYFFCCTPEGRASQLDNMNTAMFDTEGSEQNDVGGDGRGVAPTAEWQLNEQARIGKVMDGLIGR